MADHSEELAHEVAMGEHDDEYWWPDVPAEDDDTADAVSREESHDHPLRPHRA
jgi:hypothetical protein